MQLFNRNNLSRSLISFFILSIFISLLLILSFPNEINMIQGENQRLLSNLVFKLGFENNQNNIEMNIENIFFPYASLNAKSTGSVKGKLNLFGLVPMKSFVVNVIPNVMVAPSGESIGVKIEARGVMVVGLSSITDINGKKTCPAADAGFAIGDRIVGIDNNTVETEKDIIEMINSETIKGKACKVVIERNEKEITLSVAPVQCIEDRLYKLGLWVRNNIAGVGTMTFFEPITGEFAALGHGITDVNSGVLIDIDKGEVLKSKVIDIEKAKKSSPGELMGIFSRTNGAYGIIKKNTPYGIYGNLDKNKIQLNKRLIPVGLGNNVKEGPAKILTTVEDNKVEEFDIEIQKVFKQNKADSKSMIIKITDPKLIKKTGGIVQGMSGSPIIQNGRLIGSITHVLVNDPLRGYGIFIEWMLNETEISSDYEYLNVAGQ